MRKVPLLVLVATILAVPGSPRAQPSIGLRAGYGFPMGDALSVEGISDFSEKDLFRGEVPIQVELSWRFDPNLSVGAYWSYAFGLKGTQLEDFCDQIPGASCSGLYAMRFGVQVEYDLSPKEQLDPWVAVGTGMEFAHFEVKGFAFGIPGGGAMSGDLVGTLRGWEWFNAQVGLDYRASPQLAVGPYVQLAMGRYTVEDIKIGSETVAGGGIANPKTHELLTIGLRGRYDLP